MPKIIGSLRFTKEVELIPHEMTSPREWENRYITITHEGSDPYPAPHRYRDATPKESENSHAPNR